MYTNAALSFFSTFCSVVLSLLFRSYAYDYLLASVIGSIIGSIPGILLQDYITFKTKSAVFTLTGFNLVVLSCLVSITAYQAFLIDLKE